MSASIFGQAMVFFGIVVMAVGIRHWLAKPRRDVWGVNVGVGLGLLVAGTARAIHVEGTAASVALTVALILAAVGTRLTWRERKRARPARQAARGQMTPE